jgi:hypothetical protein
VRAAFEREPPVWAMIWFPFRRREAFRARPRRELRGSPVYSTELFCGALFGGRLILGLGSQKLGKVWLDDTQVMMHPTQRWLIHDVRRYDVVFGMCPARMDQCWNSSVFEKYLQAVLMPKSTWSRTM